MSTRRLASTAPAEPVVPTDQDEDENVEHDYLVEVGGRRVGVKLFAPPIAVGTGGGAAAGPARTGPS